MTTASSGSTQLGPKQVVAVPAFEDTTRYGYSQCVRVGPFVFITDTRLGRVFTSMRRDYFGDRFPTSALTGVSALIVPGALIEIQATAVLSGALTQ